MTAQEEAVKFIVARREKLGLSQLELARRSGVGQATVSRFENGLGGVTLGTLARLAAALDCEVQVEFLVTGQAIGPATAN